MAFVDRLPDRGEPYTPDRHPAQLTATATSASTTRCKMLHVFPENEADLELRELFNVCWYPAGVVEGQPAAPDVQSMPSGRYGNIFDVLVDRPEKAKAIFDYPVVWAAGDVELGAAREDARRVRQSRWDARDQRRCGACTNIQSPRTAVPHRADPLRGVVNRPQGIQVRDAV